VYCAAAGALLLGDWGTFSLPARLLPFLFSFFFFLFLHSQFTGFLRGVIMLAAVKEGDAKELAGLMRQDPGFKVNMDQDRHSCTLLHYACDSDSRSAAITLLLAHPDIHVNVKTKSGITPFALACNGPLLCSEDAAGFQG